MLWDDAMLVVDYYTDKEIINKLKKLDEVVLTKPNKNIYSGIEAHPDLLVRQLDKNTLAVDEENINYYKEKFSDYELIAIEKISTPYPNHIKLNYVVFNNLFIHNIKYTDKKVLEYYKNKGYELIDVKQGYTKCNIAVGKNSLITSDTDIYNKLKNKTKILQIDHKQIELRNFNYGFIGGASGLIKDTLYFTGSLKHHSSYEKIINFLNKNEKYDYLSENQIVDIGSIIEIK